MSSDAPISVYRLLCMKNRMIMKSNFRPRSLKGTLKAMNS